MDKYIFPILGFIATQGIIVALTGWKYLPISTLYFVIGYVLGVLIAKQTK